jgi:DNA-binding transcriptional MerR regulator
VNLPKAAADGGYSTKQLCDYADISYRQADSWDRSELLVPSIRRANGSGAWPRRYSAEDMTKARLTAELAKAGVSVEAIRRDGDPLVTMRRLFVRIAEIHAEFSDELDQRTAATA